MKTKATRSPMPIRWVVRWVCPLLILHGTLSADGLFEKWGQGDIRSVKAAIDNNADLNAKGVDGISPLMMAALFNPTPEVIPLLAGAGAEINAGNDDGLTALMLVAAQPSRERWARISAELIAAGADMGIEDNNGRTVLDLAIEYRNVYVIAELIKSVRDRKALRQLLADSSPNTVDSSGLESLVEAVVKKQPKTVEILLELGADPNELDQGGLSPLFWALHTEAPLPIIEALLLAGADADTALDSRLTEEHRTNRQTFSRTMNSYVYVDPHKERIDWTQGVLDLIIEHTINPEE